MNLNRVKVLLKKELTQIRRDKSLFGILIVAPMIQLLVLGNAATTDVRDISMAVRDNDHTYQSREYIRAMGASGYFHITLLTGPEKGDGDLLVSGDAGLVVVIPPGFGRTPLQRSKCSWTGPTAISPCRV